MNKVQEKFVTAHTDYSDAMFRYCYVRVSNREQALDLTQEAFMKTWKHLYEGKAIKNLKAFLFTTLNNLIIDWYRKKKALPLDEKDASQIPDEQHTKDPSLEAEGKWALSLLNKLDAKSKTVVMLRFVEGWSPKEIAKHLGEKENAISVRIHRGLASLKELTKN